MPVIHLLHAVCAADIDLRHPKACLSLPMNRSALSSRLNTRFCSCRIGFCFVQLSLNISFISKLLPIQSPCAVIQNERKSTAHISMIFICNASAGRRQTESAACSPYWYRRGPGGCKKLTYSIQCNKYPDFIWFLSTQHEVTGLDMYVAEHLRSTTDHLVSCHSLASLWQSRLRSSA